MYEGFRITRWQVNEATICGEAYRFSQPLDVRGLITDEDDTLWMSDVPQERAMMFTNARHSSGHILVGGLGLGMYPQYAAPHAASIHIVERNPHLAEVVMPTVEVAAAPHNLGVSLTHATIEDALNQPPTTRYDTIFLDTWHQLDPLLLPQINALRDAALPHLAEGGRVLLWGYAWLLRLFAVACEQVLSRPPSERHALLEKAERPAVAQLLRPVVEHFARNPIEEMRWALAWCRQYATEVTP